MISLEPQDLYNEIKDAESLRKKHLDITKDIIGYMVGRKFRTDHDSDRSPENYFFAYQAFVLPQLVFERPVVKCSTTKMVTDAETADAIEMALNQWIKETKFKDLLSELALDSLIGFGVSKVGLELVGDHEGQGLPAVFGDFEMTPSKPFAVRIDPSDFIIDAYCKKPSEARLIGHRFERDLEDLKLDSRYDPAAIEGLRINEPEKPEGSPFQKVGDRQTNRKTVTLYELYIPEHAKLITLAINGAGGADSTGGPAILRTAQYYGPKEGPFTTWGLYLVPGQVYPLSPMMALFDQFLELNDHAAAASDEAASYKRVGLVDANDPELAKNLKDAKNGDLIKAKNINGKQEMEVGGTSEGRLSYIDVLRERLDRLMGFSDAQRGKASGVTATEASIADNNSDLRLEHMRQKTRDNAHDLLRKVGWYVFYEETVIQAVSRVDPVTQKPVQGYVMGGVWPGQEQQNYVDLAIDIDPYSMVRVDDALLQKRAQDAIVLISQMAPMIPQMPYVNWTGLLDQWGETMNIKKFSEVALNLPMLQAMMGQMAMQQQAAQMGMGVAPGMMPPGSANLPMGQPGMPGAGPMTGTTSQGNGILAQSPNPMVGGTTHQGLRANATGRMPSAA